jgi:hypothetical protein
MGHFELPKSASSFGVNDPLWDSLSVKMGEEIDKMEVLEEDGAPWTNGLGGGSEGDWAAAGSCVNLGHACRYTAAEIVSMRVVDELNYNL